MRFNIDGYYEIGASHSICEDYVLVSKPNDNFCFGIVCDGCTGSPNTEMGARIVAHHAKKAIDEFYKFDPFFTMTEAIQYFIMPMAKKIISAESEHTAQFLGLPIECLDVTTWILFGSKKENDIRFSVMGWGDGQVIVRTKNSSCIYAVNYPSQAPFYLAYYFNYTRMKNYMKNFSPNLEFSRIIFNNGILDPLTTITINKEIRPCNTPTILHIPNNPEDPVISITICTDGLKTFNGGLQPENEEYGSLLWAAKRAIDYQSLEGVFVERRMKALSRRDAKDNIKHHDDIGMVSVLLMENEENG